jgi:Fe-S cluster assembly protein SufD
LYVTTAGEKPVAIHPRTLVVADESSEVRVVESFAGIGTGAYFVNPVTEVFIGSNATVDFGRVEHEGAGGMHVGTIQFCQERDSNVLCHIVTLDGRLVRHDVNALLDGEGCDCSLNGFYVVEGSRHVDNHLWVDHAKPHCDSREFFKGVLAEHGRGVFSGKIIVREHAQKTDAKQTNQSLLLSPDAQVESKPQLEIFADDVKCTHGATVGQVSEESMFYLRSRGLDAQAARNMLVYAFAAEALESLRIGPLKARLEAELFARLPKISAESQAGS